MAYKKNYNERAWSIDLIGYIKSYVKSINRSIKEAGGENSIITDGSSLFPDVLLFGDKQSAKILQGWELKMPDTDINDLAFYENAKKKAEVLGLDSMVLWNVSSAHLYILDKKTRNFELVKVWEDLIDITTRKSVQSNAVRWQKLSIEIIDTVNDYLDSGKLEGKRFIEAYRSGGLTSLILENTGALSDTLERHITTDKYFRAQVTLWLDKNSNEYNLKKNQNKLDLLSRAILSNWLGKFLFAHILTASSTPTKKLLDTIHPSTTADEALLIFEKISDKCNFWTIFSENIGMKFVPKAIWAHFLQLNLLLSELKIGEIEQQQLSDILEDTVSIASRKLRGQYTTPQPLAKLLVELTLNNPQQDRVADFCSGSGTIVREVHDLKLQSCTAKQSSEKIYASDIDYYANQMTTFALAKPSGMDIPIRVFNSDIFKLYKDTSITFKDPRNGKEFQEKLGVFDVILSNLPFISQSGRKLFKGSLDQVINNLPTEYDFLNFTTAKPFNRKSDVYAYIPFHILPLLKQGGQLGLIISNAWLGTEWGISFLYQLTAHYHLKTVITSGAGRWFENSEVVTNILILEKRVKNDVTLEDVDFVTLKRPLSDLEKDDNYLSKISSQIILGSVNSSEALEIRTVNIKDIFTFIDLGVGISSQFIDCDWLLDLPLAKISSFMISSRGKRRGWDALFYPSTDEGIEDEFLEPLLLNSKSIKQYIVSPDYKKKAFCCSATESELIADGKTGAYRWIQKFKHSKNNSGKPLTEALKQSEALAWYDFGQKTKADLVVTMNPEKRFFVARIQEPSIINQRLICLNAKEGQDIDLLHALLNSALTYFLIESSGFGRGLGALDLKSTSFNSMFMLDPNQLKDKDREAIKNSFKPLLHKDRLIYSIDEELESEDRIKFDKVVLQAFGIAHLQLRIYDSLLKLVAIRLEAKNV